MDCCYRCTVCSEDFWSNPGAKGEIVCPPCKERLAEQKEFLTKLKALSTE